MKSPAGAIQTALTEQRERDEFRIAWATADRSSRVVTDLLTFKMRGICP